MTAGTTEDVTIGELGRRMDTLAQMLTDAVEKLSGKLDERPDWNDIKRVESGLIDKISAEVTARKVHDAASDKAVKALEDNNKWIIRTTVAAIVAALSSAPVAIFVAIATRQ